MKRLGAEPPVKPLVDIPRMDAQLQEMIRDALAAKDDLVDELRNTVLQDLLDIMIKDPQTVARALELLIVARHLERAADHLTNVCERVVYMVTGEMRELNV